MAQKDIIARELQSDYTEPIRDPLWKHIYLSPALKEIINHPEFQKLGRIKQLGPAFHVYPGATHTRLNHSLGVAHIAKRIIQALITAPDCPELSVEGVRAFICAALLHDLGHFPYAHSLKELPLIEHEALTAEIILSKDMSVLIKEHLGTDPQMVAGIVDLDLPNTHNAEIDFFRNILSGVLDPDKLDYLNRDAYFCGIPYGVQDTDFVISKMLPHSNSGIAVSNDGIAAVENVLFSKYLMYKSVYWHRAVRIATAMIKKALYTGMHEGRLTPQQLYGLDDEAFNHLFAHSSYLPFSLITKVANRELYKTVYEVPYNEKDHKKYLNLEQRWQKEEEIAQELRVLGMDVSHLGCIIDIPEAISFEVELPIYRNGTYIPFPEAGAVFSRPVVRGFTDALRKVRLFLPREMTEKFKTSGYDCSL